MPEVRERRKTNDVTQSVADEGNVPGHPSIPGVLAIVVIVLIGAGLIYLASTSETSHPPRSAPQSSRQ
jgi:hypothetical protein